MLKTAGAKLLNLYSFSSASAIAMRLSRAPGLKYVPAVVVELVAAGLKYVLAVVVACVPPAQEVPGPRDHPEPGREQVHPRDGGAECDVP